jgi:lactate permease
MDIFLALLPLVTAFFMLAIWQRPGMQAGLGTVIITALLIWLTPTFDVPGGVLPQTFGSTLSTAFVVLYVLFPSLWLYRLQQAAGTLAILAQSLQRLCPQRDLQVLLLVMGLAPFVESASGFGVGTVIVIPFLIAAGLPPLRAAALGLLGQMAVPWGALAVGTVLGAQLTGVSLTTLSAKSALLGLLLPAFYGLIALGMSGGKNALKRWGWLALLSGGIMVAAQWFFSVVGAVELAGVLAGLLVLLVLSGVSLLVRGTTSAEVTGQAELFRACAPYLLLTTLLLLTRLISPLRTFLQQNGVLNLPDLRLNIAFLYNPGTWVFVTILVMLPFLRIKKEVARQTLRQTSLQFYPGAIAITAFIGTGRLMSDGGMIAVLGEAAANLGSGYTLISPWLGALGGWLTGSNAGGNAMFAPLQLEAARRTALPLDWLMAAQNTAGSHATMLSPARTVLAVTTAELPGAEGKLIRQLGGVLLAALTLLTVTLLIFVALFP